METKTITSTDRLWAEADGPDDNSAYGDDEFVFRRIRAHGETKFYRIDDYGQGRSETLPVELALESMGPAACKEAFAALDRIVEPYFLQGQELGRATGQEDIRAVMRGLIGAEAVQQVTT